MSDPTPSRLHRSLGVRGATIVGLSAMLGTGVFAVWTPAWQLVGTWLPLTVICASLVAALNAVSSARLAVVHPESGGAYAYGRIRIGRAVGVLAGSCFVVGKSASAAAAALTIGAYLAPDAQILVALLAVVLALAIDLRGIVTSTRVSAVLVVIVIAVLVVLVVATWMTTLPANIGGVSPGMASTSLTVSSVIVGTGLVFVAFAGYARITVLGEEVRAPRRTIPRAIVLSFAIVLVIYLAVSLTVVHGVAGGVELGESPLLDLAAAAGGTVLPALTRIAAVLAAGAVLVSLLAGIGRTVFAMASRGDAPAPLSRVGARIPIPYRAEIAAAIAAAVLVLVGRIGWALALSAATIMAYYSVTHLAAWTLPGRGRGGGHGPARLPHGGRRHWPGRPLRHAARQLTDYLQVLAPEFAIASRQCILVVWRDWT